MTRGGRQASERDVRPGDGAVGLLGRRLKAGLSTLDGETRPPLLVERLLLGRRLGRGPYGGREDEEGAGVQEVRGRAEGA